MHLTLKKLVPSGVNIISPSFSGAILLIIKFILHFSNLSAFFYFPVLNFSHFFSLHALKSTQQRSFIHSPFPHRSSYYFSMCHNIASSFFLSFLLKNLTLKSQKYGFSIIFLIFILSPNFLWISLKNQSEKQPFATGHLEHSPCNLTVNKSSI